MGDRFYEQQKKAKPARRLKKDIVLDIEAIIGSVPGLDKLTIASLDKLLENIKHVV